MNRSSKLLLLLFAVISLMFLPPADIISIAGQCSTSSLKKNLYYLASDKMEGRLMGMRGDTLASEFVAAEFKKAGLTAPYKRSYYQTITATELVVEGSLDFQGKKLNYIDGWKVYPTNPLALRNTELLLVNDTSWQNLSKYIAGHNVNNKALVLPARLLENIFKADIIDSLEAVWKRKGVAALVYTSSGTESVLKYLRMRWHTGDYKNSLLDPIFRPGTDNKDAMPEIGLGKNILADLLAKNKIKVTDAGNFEIGSQGLTGQVIPIQERISVSVTNRTVERTAPNVIGVLQGIDTTLPVMILSAHHDHDGKTAANEIYYGAVDNASGTVAIIEIARLLQLAASQGLRPKRTLVFASFTGEERGELGSSWYVEHPLHPLSKTYGVFNIDMLGRVDTFYSGRRADSSYAYFLVKDSLHQFRKGLTNANKTLGELKLDPYYEDPRYMTRRLEGSDQFPFYIKGVPFIRIDCGFAKEYHELGDTPDKINYDLLTKQTKLAFLTLWNILNE